MVKTEIDACDYAMRSRMGLKIRFMNEFDHYFTDNRKWKDYSELPRTDILPELSRKDLVHVFLKDN